VVIFIFTCILYTSLVTDLSGNHCEVYIVLQTLHWVYCLNECIEAGLFFFFGLAPKTGSVYNPDQYD